MKSIVTGGCGFIGSHIVDRLLAEGQDVTVIDNCSTGRLENLAHHKGDPHLTIVEADICDHDKIAPLFEGVDWVFHMAAGGESSRREEIPLHGFFLLLWHSRPFSNR